MGDPEHLQRLKQNFRGWNYWRKRYRHIRPDLSRSDLHGANLHEANLGGADLYLANLSGADLSEASLHVSIEK